jgi:hypothetical protein
MEFVFIISSLVILYSDDYVLERDTKDVDEVFIIFKCLFIKIILCLYSGSVMIVPRYINIEV